MSLISVSLRIKSSLCCASVKYCRGQQRYAFILQRKLSSDQSSFSEPKPNSFDLNLNDSKFYDIVIAGGGLVGTVLAVALARNERLAGKKILLLESSRSVWTKEPEEQNQLPDYSNRVVALSPGSKSLLTKLGIWDKIWRLQEVNSLQVWDALSDAHISFKNPDFESPVSFIVENPVLQYGISELIPKLSNISVEFGSKLGKCVLPTVENPDAPAYVILEDNRTIKTDLLIGADGFNSKVRNSINSPYLNFNYDRTAVVATLKLTESYDNTVAWQRFLPSGGPIALLPLSNDYSSLVWSTTVENSQRLLDSTPEEFVDEINSAFWREYPRSTLVQKSCEFLSAFKMGGKGPRIFPPSVSEVVEKSRAKFPLGFGHAAYYVSRRVALIGDAAHRVHPLAGQGLNLGLGDVETLERVIDKTVGIGGDIGNLAALHEYETERQRHNVTIQSGIDFLHRLFDTQFSPIVALRTIGLSAVNSSEYMKKIIISQAAA